eukprot:9491262-Pyramimonas_sp.AAC.1
MQVPCMACSLQPFTLLPVQWLCCTEGYDGSAVAYCVGVENESFIPGFIDQVTSVSIEVRDHLLLVVFVTDYL